MTMYMVASFDVAYEDRYAEYGRLALPLVVKHKGIVVTADRSATALEGPPRSMVLVIAFPSEADALGFYDDPEYRPVKAIRHVATTSHSLLLSRGV